MTESTKLLRTTCLTEERRNPGHRKYVCSGKQLVFQQWRLCFGVQAPIYQYLTLTVRPLHVVHKTKTYKTNFCASS